MIRFLPEIGSPYRIMSPFEWFLAFFAVSFDCQWSICRWLFLAVTVLLVADRLLRVHEEEG